MNLNVGRRDISPQALRQAVRDVITLDEAGQLANAEDEIGLVLKEERARRLQRTLGQECRLASMPMRPRGCLEYPANRARKLRST
ncbi:MAG TPA: hypothetical protein VGJ16_10745 [Pirellulales bacterium]|jgi:hypothetical protein